MIGDQHPCIAASSALLQNRLQACNEIITILIVIEDIAASDAASDNVVQSAGSINSGLTWHEKTISNQLRF